MSKKARNTEAQRARLSRETIVSALLAALILREANIEADGNDTAGKVIAAIEKLSKKKGGAA